MNAALWFLVAWLAFLAVFDLFLYFTGMETITGSIRAIVHEWPWTALAIWAVLALLAFHLTGLTGEMMDKARVQ